jgi:putative oxidoreductase
VTRWLNKFQPWGVTLLRLVLGVAMVYHSWHKVYPAGGFGHGPLLSSVERFNDTVVKLGMPRWLGYVSTASEFVGGLSMVFGLLTRFWALMIAGNLLIAIVMVTIHRGYSGTELPLALMAMAVMILLAGPGAAALDRRIGLH